MPLNISAAHSSRISKYKNPSLKGSASSPFASLNQRKCVQRTRSKPETVDEDDNEFLGDRLEDVGVSKSLATDLSLRDVAQIIQYTSSHTFDVVPENGGLNSTKIAEILNSRASLPPFVTLSHVHAMTESPTTTEREIAELTKAGIITRIVIPGRGIGGSTVGDGLILLKDIERLTRRATNLESSVAGKLLEYLRANPMSYIISSRMFSVLETKALMRAGFLTSVSRPSNSTNVFASPDSGSLGTITSISCISRAASGSMAAVGGEDAIHDAGGRGGFRRSSQQSEKLSDQGSERFSREGEQLTLSLPSIGQYLKLLTSARSHMLSLIMKSKYREMPLYLLRERWDGGIAADDPATKAKKYRREFTGVLPSRTRKWKQFKGLRFDWILAECLGAGLVELFETGSVGRAVRLL